MLGEKMKSEVNFNDPSTTPDIPYVFTGIVCTASLGHRRMLEMALPWLCHGLQHVRQFFLAYRENLIPYYI